MNQIAITANQSPYMFDLCAMTRGGHECCRDDPVIVTAGEQDLLNGREGSLP